MEHGVIPLDQVAHELRGPHPWIPGVVFGGHPGLAEHLARAVEAFASPQDAKRVCPLCGGEVEPSSSGSASDVRRCRSCAELLWPGELVQAVTDQTIIDYLAKNSTNCPVCSRVGEHTFDCRIGRKA